ncbi:glutamate 5-kinase [Altericroceibacterium endophyticum]|uniref:Glutamate 5-kinase n=1 Tax=Altericroceibacterium endophyticum TaxID=1808508 RepID=A0A6I4T8N9_9SPHN|nr:glutamate 5-kinase [Altericroceibacterium endophyticum]MXO66393.1 glutamate 5-kinase [Altericroceibacterium endophyticum]
MSISKLSDLADPVKTPRIVFKIGSSLLVEKSGDLRNVWLNSLAGEISEARKRGQEVIVVSSGAVALGAARLGLEKGGRGSLADKQAAAAVGQIALSGLWAQLLSQYGLVAAQLLLTLEDLEYRRRYLNASATIGRLLKAGTVPIVNENDSIATNELRFGDNDRLAARVAQAGQAQAIALFSDVDGLFDRDPKHPDANLLERIKGVTEDHHQMASGASSSGVGTGGMSSKLLAVEIAERAGISLAILNGLEDQPFRNAIESDTGTLFLPRRHDTARKAWLGGRQRMRGTLIVDTGCAGALVDGGSLLAAGITEVQGNFQRGQPVAIKNEEGKKIAQGMVEYDREDVEKIMGHTSEEQEELLGYSPRSAVVHRDQLVVL